MTNQQEQKGKKGQAHLQFLRWVFQFPLHPFFFYSFTLFLFFPPLLILWLLLTSSYTLEKLAEILKNSDA